MTLSPIALFTYNRPRHTRQAVETLKKNEPAVESELYIFSDGPKTIADEPLVREVREYIKTIDGFKTVSVVERDRNLSLADSVIVGISVMFERFDSVIVVEDDLLVHPQFLEFMNHSLHRFRDSIRVFSVTGFSYPPDVVGIPPDYPFTTYFAYHSWGWATWKDRWEKTDFVVPEYPTFRNDREMQKRFNRGGEDLSDMLSMQMMNRINSWAIRFCFSHFKHDAYCLYPVRSLVRNIGFDEEATHTRKVPKRSRGLFQREFHSEHYEISYPGTIEVDPKIAEGFRRIFRYSFRQRFGKILAKAIGGAN